MAATNQLEPGHVHGPDCDHGPDERSPEELAREARRRAAHEHLTHFGDPVLRSRAREVERFDDELRAEVARMARLMEDAQGVGLAAPQVGQLRRLLVIRPHHDGPVLALVNPTVEYRSDDDQDLLEEGCLSLPGVHVDVERPVHVRVRARDEHGEVQVVEASGFEARVIQHELDHLDGVLILDRAPRDQRRAAIKALREAERT